jgi:predicted amidohydrolase
MKVGFYQFAPEFGDIKYNLQKFLDAAASVETDLLVLPELFNTGYQFTSREEAAALSEEIPSGFTTNALIKLSAKKKVYIAAGIAEYSEGKIYNSAVLTGPDDSLAFTEKHIFSMKKNSGFLQAIQGLKYGRRPSEISA